MKSNNNNNNNNNKKLKLFHFDNFAWTMTIYIEDCFLKSFGSQNILYTCIEN